MNITNKGDNNGRSSKPGPFYLLGDQQRICFNDFVSGRGLHRREPKAKTTGCRLWAKAKPWITAED